MNTRALKQAERAFLTRYPGGFLHEEMVAVTKKHKMDQIVEFAQSRFAKTCFGSRADIVADMVRLVGRSSLVSMFEKPKFKSMVSSLNSRDQGQLVDALYELLHGKEKAGFEQLVDELGKRKLAKWTLATVFQASYRPNKDVFVKPTTAKLIVEKLELDLAYQSAPTWEFYRDFRKHIKEFKTKVDKSLAPNNAAFCGFLMVALGDKL